MRKIYEWRFLTVDFYEWRNSPTVIGGIVTPDPLSRLRLLVIYSGLHAGNREYKILAIRFLRDERKRSPRRRASR